MMFLVVGSLVIAILIAIIILCRMEKIIKKNEQVLMAVCATQQLIMSRIGEGEPKNLVCTSGMKVQWVDVAMMPRKSLCDELADIKKMISEVKENKAA